MASFNVTHDTPVEVVTATHAMTVAVNVNGTGLSVYLQVNNVGHFPIKAYEGRPVTLNLVKDDVVQAYATGTGTIDVTIT